MTVSWISKSLHFLWMRYAIFGLENSVYVLCLRKKVNPRAPVTHTHTHTHTQWRNDSLEIPIHTITGDELGRKIDGMDMSDGDGWCMGTIGGGQVWVYLLRYVLQSCPTISSLHNFFAFLYYTSLLGIERYHPKSLCYRWNL